MRAGRGHQLVESGRFDGSLPAAIVVAIFAVVFILLTTISYTQKSAVWDEPIHIADGYVSLVAQDFRVDPEHPPFLRMWAALPLLGLQPRFTTAVIDATPPSLWARSPFQFGGRFLYQDNDADRLLMRTRFMMVLLGVGLGVLLFVWAREWLGFWPAVVALTLFTFEPNILAHSSLVTTDIGFTCFMFGTLYFIWRMSREPAAGNVAGLVVFFALAAVSKYSAIVLAPIVVVLLAAAVWRGRLTAAAAAGTIALITVAAWLAIWAVYGFRWAPETAGQWVYAFQNDAFVQQAEPGLMRVVAWIDSLHLLPNAYSQGFLFGQAKSVRPEFFAGEFGQHGWWSYFPVAIAIKTPIAFLALAAIGAVVAIARRRGLDGFGVFCVIAPLTLFLFAAMTSTLNIGVRHVLPIYPLMMLLAGVAAREALTARATLWRGALVAVVAAGVLETARVYPDNLTFFNALAGGPSGGGAYLTDSNLDWGQDLKPLKRWMDANQVSHINLAYFGTASPVYYGIHCTLLPGATAYGGGATVQLPGYVAISDTVLNGVYLGERERAFYQPFKGRTPTASIGNSIHVFWVDHPWWQ